MKRSAITRRTPLARGKPLKSGKPMKRGAPLRAKGGLRFPKRRDPAYRQWVCGFPCLLRGRVIGQPFSIADRSQGLGWREYEHICWGPIDPAHVGPHQATGAGDRGMIVPLCRAAHQFYDERRHAWTQATGWTAPRMADEAARLYQTYLRETGRE